MVIGTMSYLQILQSTSMSPISSFRILSRIGTPNIALYITSCATLSNHTLLISKFSFVVILSEIARQLLATYEYVDVRACESSTNRCDIAILKGNVANGGMFPRIVPLRRKALA